MAKVLFSHSYYYPLDPKQWKTKTPYPPLGTLYAASNMREQGYAVALFDTNLLDSPDTITVKIKTENPKYLVLYDDGFNYLTKMCLVNMREAAFKMLQIGKKHQCITIVNSSDATDHYQKYLDQGADYVIQGEGEATLLELINILEKNQTPDNVNGIVYQNKGKTVINPKRPVLQKLDDLPLPAWDLVDIDAYKNVWKQNGKEFTLNMATTRGCPFKCNWCAKPIYGNRYNSHSPEYIAQHIKLLQERYGVKRFWMCDDIFGLKPNWVQQFREVLKKEKLSIKYFIQSRADLLLKEDTIDALAATGLEEVWIGAESGSQKILDAMDKGTTIQQIHKATQLIKKKDIRIAFFLQFGYPGENKEDIDMTLNMVKKLMPDRIGISVSYPLPGTKFYERVKNDLKAKANWTDSDDLDMMFQGTFNSNYYKKLHRYVHREYGRVRGLQSIKTILKNPFKTTRRKVQSAFLTFYYGPIAYVNKFQLNRLEIPNG